MSRYCPKCGSKLWHEGYCRSCLEFTTLHTSFDDGQEELKKPKHIDQINHQVNAASNNRMPNSVTPITHTDSGSSNLIGAVLVAIPTVISCITNVTPFIGIVFYFLNFPTITIACAILQLLNSVIQCINGTQKGLFTEIITLVGAIIINIFVKASVIPFCALVFCIVDALMVAVGIIMLLISVNSNNQ